MLYRRDSKQRVSHLSALCVRRRHTSWTSVAQNIWYRETAVVVDNPVIWRCYTLLREEGLYTCLGLKTADPSLLKFSCRSVCCREKGGGEV